MPKTGVDWTGPSDHSVLCSLHFTKDCFEPSTVLTAELGLPAKRRKLKDSAVPSLFPKAADVRAKSTEWAVGSVHYPPAQVHVGLSTCASQSRSATIKRERSQVGYVCTFIYMYRVYSCLAMSRSKNLSISHFIGKVLEDMNEMEAEDSNDLHLHASTFSVASQAFPCIQARVLPPTRYQVIYSIYTCSPRNYMYIKLTNMYASNAGVNGLPPCIWWGHPGLLYINPVKMT